MTDPKATPVPEDPHPRHGDPQFIARLGHGQGSLVALLHGRGMRCAAAPLYFLEHNRQLSLIPAALQMGRVLDPCSQHRQRPWAERSKAFRALPYGSDPEPYEPDRARLSDEQLLALALGPLDLQRGNGATLLLSTYHLAGGPDTRGREIELLLAELAVRHFRQQRMEQPPPFSELSAPREIYLAAALRVEDLTSPRDRLALADSYAALAGDGLWVSIKGFHHRASLKHIRAGAAFLAALNEARVPIVCSGSGQLHLPLLAGGISASIGLGEGELFTLPAAWKPMRRDGRRRGRTRMAYNASLHRSFRIGSKQAADAFAKVPCTCGRHAASKPPDGCSVGPHAAVLRAEQASEALHGESAERREWVQAAAVRASWKAHDVGLSDTEALASRYKAVLVGLDAGREPLPGEQIEL